LPEHSSMTGISRDMKEKGKIIKAKSAYSSL